MVSTRGGGGWLRMLLQVEAVLLLVAVASALLVARGLRRMVRVTDPRVPVLLCAAEALDAGLDAGLAASSAGRGLRPPAECAYPQDLVVVLAARGAEPSPVA